MKYLSLFSGIGGFELGIQQAYDALSKTAREQQGRNQGDSPVHGEPRMAPECIGFSEIDKYAIQIYERHFQGHNNYGNIKSINTNHIDRFDLLVGGFPCQSFSIAGKRGGFNDTRGTLFFEIARILHDKQPPRFLLENVKGLLSHDSGRTFKRIISTLDELGYDLQWQVLNSKNFGVPQNRERVFIVGHLRGTARPEVFPFAGGYTKNLEQIIGGGQGNRLYSVEGISTTIASQAGGQGAKTELYAIAERGRYKADGSTEQRLEPRYDGVTNTLTSVEKDNRMFDGMRIRRLTPTECERLQGFPDGWTEGMSDTQRYKCLGNAVTVNVVREIMKKLI